ncbi:hypothetical protein BC834DRAFT_897667, partial [Gloeopeniophorella convolvens]
DEAARAEVRATLLNYLGTDTIWCPPLAWAHDAFGVGLLTSESVFLNSQPAEAKAALDRALQGLGPWQVEAAGQTERWGEARCAAIGHDVDCHDARRHLGSAARLLASV